MGPLADQCVWPRSIGESGRASKGFRPAYHNALSGLRGMFFVMGPVNSAIVRRSWSILQRAPLLLSAAPSSSAASSSKWSPAPSAPVPARYGKDFTYDESMCLGPRGKGMSALSSWFFGLVLTAFGAAFAGSSLVRSFVKLVAPVSGSGPSEESVVGSPLRVSVDVTMADPGRDFVFDAAIFIDNRRRDISRL